MNKKVNSVCSDLNKLAITSVNPLNTMDEYNKEVLKKFPYVLRKNFEYLLTNQRTEDFPSQISDIKSSKWAQFENISYNFGFTIGITYAGTELIWEILFTPTKLRFAPDFNFNDDTFTLAEDLDVVTEKVPSLNNWNIEDPKSLTRVLHEFLDLYKEQQITKLSRENIYADLCAEYLHLTQTIKHLRNVEVQLENGNVHFAINLSIDVTTLIPYATNDEDGHLLNAGNAFVWLKVSYMKMRTHKTNVILSPALEYCLGNTKQLNLPHFTKDTQLGAFVIKMAASLREQIKKKVHQYTAKKDLFSYAVSLFATSPIEIDCKDFTKFSVGLQVDGYECIVHVHIGPNFPDEMPTVILESIYCFTFTKPCFYEIDNYPYSPRWKPKDMLNKLLVHLNEAIQKFQYHSH